ncbi:MAG TPA: phosphotransferase [Phototrophicaceae bacterium]|nr:phosphotransferase [Phototrophicaceae bacterium]
MAINFNLPEFKRMLVSVAMNLLHASERYSGLILTEADVEGNVPLEALRASWYYVKGLLAYGFELDDDVLDGILGRAAKWFATPFPTPQHQTVDEAELYRLEVALLLRQDEAAQGRLSQLAEQCSADRLQLVIPEQPAASSWALALMCAAYKQGFLPSSLTADDLKIMVDHAVMAAASDDELALAFRLRYDLFGRLTSDQNALLRRQFSRAGSLWRFGTDMDWLLERMRQHELSAQDIQENYALFWAALQRTSLVVIHLTKLLYEGYTELHAPLLQALEMWLGAFFIERPDPISELQMIFAGNPDEDYLTALALTLIALQAFLEDKLTYYTAAYVQDQLLDYRSEGMRSSEKENIKQTLRAGMPIEWAREPKKLNLGLSGATVLRVNPLIRNPLDANQTIFSSSVIVKYGSSDDIKRERDNYKQLPDFLCPYFVSVPQETYQDAAKRAYIIMPDLTEYQTLYEAICEYRYPELLQNPALLARSLSKFLVAMHRAGSSKALPAGNGTLYDLYLLPMHQNIAKIFNLVWDWRRNRVAYDEKEQQRTNLLQAELVKKLADLATHQTKLEKFSRAYMHGDLHTRNIMIDPRRVALADGDDFNFKLIDLEKVRSDGDIALDIAQLRVDVEVTINERRRIPDDMVILDEVIRQVLQDYQTFAQERADETFDLRLQLGIAYSYLRIAKGKTRQIEQHLKNGRRPLADTLVADMLSHCERAGEYMEAVLKSPTIADS